MADPRAALDAATDMNHALTADQSIEWTPNDGDRVEFGDPEDAHLLGTVLTVRPGQWARVHWDDGLVSIVDIDDLRPADAGKQADPRALLEQHANRTAFHHPDAGDIPVAHVAPNMLDALRAVLDWCDTKEAATRVWEQNHSPECECSVASTTYGLIEEVRAAITNALEGNHG